MINREVKMAGYLPGVFFLFVFFPACLWTRHSQSSPIKLNSHKVGCSIWFNFQTHLNSIHGLSSVRLIWLSSISERCINYVGLWTKMEVRFITSQKNEWGRWVIPEKNAHPPDGWGRFLTPLSPGFPEAQDPPSCLDVQDKRSPPTLPPGFRWKNIRLKFHLFLIENTHNHT